jgi:hypothetical protein
MLPVARAVANRVRTRDRPRRQNQDRNSPLAAPAGRLIITPGGEPFAPHVCTDARPGTQPRRSPGRPGIGGNPMRVTSCFLGASLLFLGISAVSADEKSGVNDEGFMQKWLVLAPIPLKSDESGAAGNDREAVKDEAKLKPKAGDKVKVDDKELAWKEYTAKDHLLDFNGHLGAQTEDAIGYAVTFITSPDDMKVKMKTGSDDQCKVWLNGKEVFKFTEPRPADKDQDSTDVELKKGVNVLVVKVVNEKIEWSFCVRFTDKDDKPITTLKSDTKE